MKKFATCLFIAINFTVSFSSYGADSHDNGSEQGRPFDPLLWYSSPESPELPLPHLPTREEIAVQRSAQDEREKRKRTREEGAQGFAEEQQHKRARLTSSKQDCALSTASSSSRSSTIIEHPAGKSLLEQLALTLFERNIWPLIPPQSRTALTLTSTSLRKRSQGLVQHLAIPISDITEETVANIAEKFKKATRVTIYRSANKEVLTSEKIALLATKFPKITSLNISRTNLTETEIRALTQPGTFTSLKELNLDSNKIGNAGIAALTRASFAHTLESLNLENTGISSVGIASLATFNIFKSLKVLSLSFNKIGDAGIAKLIKAPFVHKLESLDVYHTDITSTGVETLATPGKFTALKKLNLELNKIGDAGIAALIEAPFAHTLESLNLENTRITSDGIITLATPGVFVSLKVLNLAANSEIDDEGIAALIEAPFIHTLESLDVSTTGITVDGVALLATPGELTALKKLNLESNSEIGDEGMATLIEAPFIHTLESLDVSNTDITSTGVETLAAPGKLTALKELCLSQNQEIGDEGMAKLIQAPFIQRLESLNLYDTGITSAGVASLAAPGVLKALKELDLSQNQEIGDGGIAKLIRASFIHTLKSLTLRGIGITNNGLKLITSPNICMSLRMLDIGDNEEIDEVFWPEHLSLCALIQI